jgi:UDP:flavonoid glycosyltransferase YjiC (YdhE family)
MSKILVITHGSLGDLYPYAALALGLKNRGHEVILGTCPCYRQKIEAWGLGFRPIRPDIAWLSDPEKVRYFSHPRWGLMRAGRDSLMASLRESCEDTLHAADDADVLVTMMASYATRLVAEKTGQPWVSAVHIPMGFFSTRDVPVLEVAPGLSKGLRRLGPAFWGPVFWLGKRLSRGLARPWYQLRNELSLPPAKEGNPLADSHSPLLVLALFSQTLAAKQTDWPPQTVQTGFPFLETDSELPPDLLAFLDEGPPPIVFTLGSAVSMNAGTFYHDSIACAALLGQRAVLIVGKGQRSEFKSLPPEMIAVEYAPFGKLFPRAAAVVHHGGVGTTAWAMRSGRPMLVVPFAWDQPDHAARVVRMGIGRSLPKRRYTPARAARELQRLLDDPEYSKRAAEIGQKLQEENGVETACDALEQLEFIKTNHRELRLANGVHQHALARI